MNEYDKLNHMFWNITCLCWHQDVEIETYFALLGIKRISMVLKMIMCSLIFKNLVEKDPNCLFGTAFKGLQTYDYI
jgi:hypothetical protein